MLSAKALESRFICYPIFIGDSKKAERNNCSFGLEEVEAICPVIATNDFRNYAFCGNFVINLGEPDTIISASDNFLRPMPIFAHWKTSTEASTCPVATATVGVGNPTIVEDAGRKKITTIKIVAGILT